MLLWEIGPQAACSVCCRTVDRGSSAVQKIDGAAQPDWLLSPPIYHWFQYNVWLLSGCLPTEMCKGQTTLILNVNRTTDPSKFHPITVSSVPSSVGEMERNCPVADRQKGFRRLDGIAQNVFLLRTAIATVTGAIPSSLYIAYIFSCQKGL